MGKNVDAFSTLIKNLHSSIKELKTAQKESTALASRYELNTYIRQLIGFYREFLNSLIPTTHYDRSTWSSVSSGTFAQLNTVKTTAPTKNSVSAWRQVLVVG